MSLSLSLSLSHTHTHTQYRTQQRPQKCHNNRGHNNGHNNRDLRSVQTLTKGYWTAQPTCDSFHNDLLLATLFLLVFPQYCAMVNSTKRSWKRQIITGQRELSIQYIIWELSVLWPQDKLTALKKKKKKEKKGKDSISNLYSHYFNSGFTCVTVYEHKYRHSRKGVIHSLSHSWIHWIGKVVFWCISHN